MMRKVSLVWGAVVAIVLATNLTQAETQRPNVVVLLSDDLGYKDVGCYGGPVMTPNIDSLAADGVRFEQFYSACAVCSPSRASLLTGRHHIRAGVYSWIHDTTQRSHLLEREITLAEVFKGAGYRTGHFGKWHLGLPNKNFKKPDPSDHGFDYWFATDNNAFPSHLNPNNFIKNGKPVGKLQGYSCQIVVDEAIAWLGGDEATDSPFFLNVWFHEPHVPVAAPIDLSNKYDGDRRAKQYSGCIDNTDQAIGRLLETLKQKGHENTIILYASDNGSYRADRVGGLRGEKGENWEGGIRVPGIISWPGKIKPRVEMDIPAGLIDVLPTFCGLAGLTPLESVELDGVDLTSLLMGEVQTYTRQKPMFWHLHKSRPMVALRDGDYSVVAEPDYSLSKDNRFDEKWIPAIKSGGYENFKLYNLKTDPSQKVDIGKSHPEVLARMRATLLQTNASVMADGHDWHRQE